MLKAPEPYFTLMTNQLGQRFYMSIMHYYLKIDYFTFKHLYDFDPVTDYFHYNKLLEIIENDFTESKLKEDNDSIAFSFMENDYLYIPFAATMISRFPYIKQMEQCIQTILNLSVDDKTTITDINKLILHLIYEITIPPPNRRLLFYIPYNTNPIEIYGNTIKDLPLISNNLLGIFNFLSIENILMIHCLMLLEQKIIFIHDNYKVMTEIMQTFIYLLYPLQWIHIYIPILSEDTVRYVLAFMPYIMGVDEHIFPLIKNQLDDNAESDNIVYFVNIKKNIIEMNQQQKLKKVTKKILFQHIPEYPESIWDYLTKNLKEFKKGFDQYREIKNLNEDKMSKKLRTMFVKAFSSLLGDYKKYVSMIGSLPLFNTESFLNLKCKSNRCFYSELVSTQIFNNLIQSKENFPYFEKMSLRYKDSSQLSTKKPFFQKKRSNSLNRTTKKSQTVISQTKLSIKTGFKSDESENSKIEDKIELDAYVIPPYFMGQSVFNRIDFIKIEEFITTKFKCKLFLFRCN